MKNNENIIVLGQGGQGVLKASKLLSEYYARIGKEVKTSTLIGLGVRGGGVYSHVKAGERIVSPLIMAGKCDMIIGLEQLETLRCLDYLKTNGYLVVNDLYIPPTTVSNGLEKNFEGDFNAIFRQHSENFHLFSGEQIIEKMDNKPVLNSFFLGVAARILKHDEKIWLQVLDENLSIKYVDMNMKAFMLGLDYGQGGNNEV
ncbi:2-oxoacid:acceptor oxidoreductase family protein [Blautia pseudococcoides]|uniref:Pyruvate/ketoisovalerate oxidoreductase catalytic domain-containing protein n=1 Tax=Blautia pseudococcoides TaxID=1796616 RepID=A0A1C7IB92_9FIRM|nr:2-oxoacid:acceptor oxidoreductase family protein [Blautia pseudococcoides]ANU76288.1 hypothetical protein A4V09_11230 [Blautia pseudococcoides]ASU29099.1 hypothetical protein ADH70_009695 [Blautia pseudococcoides]QJU13533.1 indolepyruvate oxidoreductase subunit beta [Blautia pseudococcoides]QQQ93862.1 2-oxoacid:acceptor oxidoreductase family protein [Blautia pseudococcoides]